MLRLYRPVLFKSENSSPVGTARPRVNSSDCSKRSGRIRRTELSFRFSVLPEGWRFERFPVTVGVSPAERA